MTDLCQSLFRNKKADAEKLRAYGFAPCSAGLCLQKTLAHCGLEMAVTVTPQGRVQCRINDPLTGEPYTLHLAGSAAGPFVNRVRDAYETTLQDIAKRCFSPDVFRWPQTKRLIDHVENTYGRTPEYLWEKFPKNAIWRRADNAKWFGVLARLAANKIGLPGEAEVEIAVLRTDPLAPAKRLDGLTVLPAYHMHKKNWYTVVLDGTAADETLFGLLQASYALAAKR